MIEVLEWFAKDSHWVYLAIILLCFRPVRTRNWEKSSLST